MRYNNFNLALRMSASLPRIKTIQEMPKLNSMESQRDLKMKFKKLALDPQQNGQERKQSLRTLKTQRLKSLQRYTTSQQQREYKNQKIHLNLIERKLLSGTYDQKKQTSSQLNILKQKRDHMKVEMVLKQREIERVKFMLNDIKQEIQVYLAKKGEHDQKLKQLKAKHEVQYTKAESAREQKGVLQNMILVRQQINFILTKRNNQANTLLNHHRGNSNVIETELRQANQKCAVQESKLQWLLKESVKQRQERNQFISKQQDKINKRIEGEVFQAQKSKQYVAHLDQIERVAEMKGFNTYYDKILSNLFIVKYLKNQQNALMEKYEQYELAYNSILSYKSFNKNDPSSLVARFLQHQPQNIRLEQENNKKQALIVALEQRNAELKKELVNYSYDLLMTEEKFNDSQLFQINHQERQATLRAKKQAEDIQQKNVRVKSYILRLLRELNQKGDKKIYNGAQTSVNNLILLTKVLKQAFKQLQ